MNINQLTDTWEPEAFQLTNIKVNQSLCPLTILSPKGANRKKLGLRNQNQVVVDTNSRKEHLYREALF